MLHFHVKQFPYPQPSLCVKHGCRKLRYKMKLIYCQMLCILLSRLFRMEITLMFFSCCHSAKVVINIETAAFYHDFFFFFPKEMLIDVLFF